jgi:hypothetical protein
VEKVAEESDADSELDDFHDAKSIGDLPKLWENDPTEAENAHVSAQVEPRSFAEAIKRPDSQLWADAALEELQAHIRNGTWTLVDLSPGAVANGSHWVFKIKRNSDGSIE